MTTLEWFTQAERTLPKLKNLLRGYHPVRLAARPQRPIGPITAPATEMACAVVRQSICENFEGDPIAQLEQAIQARDIGKTMTLLNEAWFGVPESTACWDVEGFREAVALLDDPPEEDDDGAVQPRV